MANATEDRATEISAAMNPVDGATLAVPPGGRASVTFSVNNASPNEAYFYFVTSLPSEQWSGPTADEPLALPTEFSGSLTMIISPASVTQSRDIPFDVQVLCVDNVVETGVTRSLILHVEPESSGEVAAPPAPTAAKKRSAVPREPAERPAPTTPRRPRATRPPAEPLPTEEVSVDPEPLVEDAAPLDTTAPAGNGNAPHGDPPPAVDDGFEVIQSSAAPPAGAEEQATGAERPGAAASDAPPRESGAFSFDRELTEPKDGAVLVVRSGERVLVRVKFTNTERRAQDFLLSMDPVFRLDQDWIDASQDQVNISAGGQGELTFLLKPPMNADCGDTEFIIHTGPRTGGRLDARHLVLRIPATTAVKLSTKAAAARFGPFGHAADFQLEVANAGNAETAFRIAVKSPKVEANDEEIRSGYKDVYESSDGAWTYEFDKELGNAKYVTSGRQPEARKVRLRVRRKTPWWGGFQERHTVRVAAVPVTDPGNGGKAANVVELNVSRWRLLPVPYTLAAPLFGLFLLFLLAAGAGNLQVENGLASTAEQNVYYVFGQPNDRGATLTARMRWDGPFLVPQSLKSGSDESATGLSFLHNGAGSFKPTDQFKYGVEHVYHVANATTTVRYLPAVTDGALTVSAALNAMPWNIARSVPEDRRIGDQLVQETVYVVKAPSSNWVSITLRNLGESTRVNAWIVKYPEESEFETRAGLMPMQIQTGKAPAIKVRRVDGNTGAEGELLLATTDARAQLLRIRLR